VVTLVNLAGAGPAAAVVIQAGAFAEHDIVSARYDWAAPGWAGSDTEYIHHEIRPAAATAEVGGPWLDVALPPGTQITLTLRLAARARPPSARTPWTAPDGTPVRGDGGA
jgi:hypothetical protein